MKEKPGRRLAQGGLLLENQHSLCTRLGHAGPETWRVPGVDQPTGHAKQTHRGWWRHQNAYLFTRRQGQHSDVGVAKLLNCYPKAEDDPLLVQS